MSFGGGRGNGKDFDMSDFDFDSSEDQARSSESGEFDLSDLPEDFDPSSMPGGSEEENGGFSFGGRFGMSSSDVKLQYIDDELDSYSNIWDNAKTNITEADQNRLIESLKKLSSGENIESVVDIEQVIRYFVVHNFVCNDDSYTGMMVHNYYLYEKDGQLAMIPWDYNLGFGTFSAGEATSTVNTPIDNPVSGGTSDRPMLNWIFESEEYTSLYHQYFEEFLNSVDIQGIIDNAYNLIKSYVEKDPTAFYTYEEFETGVETLRQFCSLRSESISMQLENGETTENMSYMDASAITLSDMGSMSGSMGGFGGDMPSGTVIDALSAGDSTDNIPQEMPKNFDGELPENFDFSNLSEDFNPSDIPEDFEGNFPGQSSEDQAETTPSEDSETSGDKDLSGNNMQTPDSGLSFNKNYMDTSSDFSGWLWIAVSVAVLAIGLIVAKKYKG